MLPWHSLRVTHGFFGAFSARPLHFFRFRLHQGAVQGKIRHGGRRGTRQWSLPGGIIRPVPGRAGNRHQTGQNAGGQCAVQHGIAAKAGPEPSFGLQQSRHGTKIIRRTAQGAKAVLPVLIQKLLPRGAKAHRSAQGVQVQPHAEHHLLLPERRGGPPGVRTAGQQRFIIFQRGSAELLIGSQLFRIAFCGQQSGKFLNRALRFAAQPGRSKQPGAAGQERFAHRLRRAWSRRAARAVVQPLPPR